MIRTDIPPTQSGGFTPRQFYGAGPQFHSIPFYIQRSYDVTDNKTAEMRAIERKHIYTMNDIFHREDERLKTFISWPLDWLDGHMLAQTGMFYTGEEDKVKCYFCEVEIGRWEREDQPVEEHRRWSPNCPLLRRRTTNNVPLNAEALDRVLPPLSYDECGANNSTTESHRNGFVGTAALGSHMLTSAEANTLSTLGACLPSSCSSTSSGPTYFPEYPEYAIEAARVRSFAEWPLHMKQKPEQLAEAGFFYTGVGDRVKCFSCGGGLKDWDDIDEPWEQHALWLSKCRFLKLIKGQNYIDGIIAKQKEIEAAENNQALDKLNDSLAKTPAAGQMLRSCAATEWAAEGVQLAKPVLYADSMCIKSVVKPSNTNIPEDKLCKICYADEYNTAFLPCGHVVACAKCASSVTKCPLCRKPFTDVMRVYFS